MKEQWETTNESGVGKMFETQWRLASALVENRAMLDALRGQRGGMTLERSLMYTLNRAGMPDVSFAELDALLDAYIDAFKSMPS